MKIETHQLLIVYSQRCNVSRLYKNFNSIETQQLHIVNFKGVMCHVSTKFSIRLRRNNYILFILIGVMCHVSTKIFNSIETQQLHIVYSHWCNWYVSTKFSIFNSIETHQLHIVNFKGVMCHVSTKFSISISICKYLICMVRQPGLRYSRLVLV